MRTGTAKLTTALAIADRNGFSCTTTTCDSRPFHPEPNNIVTATSTYI
jgi:hypothetical protein